MTTNVTVNEPPEFLRNYYAALAQHGMQAGQQGFEAYNRDRVAPWNSQQNAAAQMVQQRALGGSEPMRQAQTWVGNMLTGQSNVGGVQSPGDIAAIGNQYLGQTSQGVGAPGQISSVTAATGPSSIEASQNLGVGINPYAGMDNPYLNQAIDRAMGDVESRINSRFSGNAFGGTAHQQTLGRELGDVASKMRMQDYGTQQQLAESAIGRGMQAGQFNIGNQNAINQFNAGLGMQNAGIQNQMGLANANLQGQNIQNAMQAGQFNANLGAQDLSRNAQMAQALGQANAGLQGQNIQNQMQTNQFNANLAGQNLARQQGALGFVPTLAASDYADAQAMMGLGGQIQAQNQAINDANYQEFMREQQYPGQQLQWMAQGLAPQGAFSTSTQTSQGAGGNQFANMAGGAMTGYAAGNMMGINPWLTAGAGMLGGAWGGR